MFKKPFTPSKILFFGSALLPYFLDVIGPHSEFCLFLDFIALLVLGVSSLVLAVGTPELRSNGKGLIYLFIAPVAVIAYFYSDETRITARDRVVEDTEFHFKRSTLETNIAHFNHVLSATDSLKFAHRDLEGGRIWYDKLPSDIILCTTEGQASDYYAGYAYSPEDKKPTQQEKRKLNGEFTEWRKIDGHWFWWSRRDG